MPNQAIVPIHCTKPCKDLSVDMPSFKKKQSVLLSQKKPLLPATALLYVTRLYVSRFIAQFWPFQQAVFKTKLWQSCGITHVRVPSIPSRHYGDKTTQVWLLLHGTVLQHYPGKLHTLQQAHMASHHTTRHDIDSWYHANTSIVDYTTVLRIYFTRWTRETHTQNRYI